MVKAASRLARSFGISTMVIGLTVVAIGTSMPEAAIGIVSAINRANQLTLGDVIGSSIANIALIIGFSALVNPLAIQPGTKSRDIPFSLLIQVVFCLFLIFGQGINRLESSILLVGFACYLIYLARSGKKLVNLADPTLVLELSPKVVLSLRWRNAGMTLIGLTCVVVGSKLIVDHAVLIAASFGLSEAMIGATIVALGTSLPELVVSIVSVRRKEHDLLVGNIIGSNIFNILLVIGVSATIYPIVYSGRIWINLALMLMSSLMFLIMAHRSNRISRLEGTLLLMTYVIFLILAVLTSN